MNEETQVKVEEMPSTVVADAMTKFDELSTFEKAVPTVGDVRGNNAFLIPAASTNFFQLAPFSYLQLPRIPVGDTRFSYWTWDLNDQTRGRAREYVDGGELETVGITGTEHTGTIKLRGLQSAIGDLTRAENKMGIPLEAQRTRTILNHMSMTFEVEWSTLFNNDNNFGTDTDLSAKQWGDDDATPIDDVIDAAETCYDNGALPGSLQLFLSRAAWAGFRKSKQVKDTIGIGNYAASGGIPTLENVVPILDGIRPVLCPALSMKGSQLFGKHAVLMPADAPTPDSRSGLVLFSLSKAQVSGPAGLSPMLVRIPHLHADYVQIIAGYKLMMMNKDMTVRLKDVVA